MPQKRLSQGVALQREVPNIEISVGPGIQRSFEFVCENRGQNEHKCTACSDTEQGPSFHWTRSVRDSSEPTWLTLPCLQLRGKVALRCRLHPARVNRTRPLFQAVVQGPTQDPPPLDPHLPTHTPSVRRCVSDTDQCMMKDSLM